ncbi:hypothetical protein [Paraburkholderia gardini]|jgi:hypothetical protein|nr:hypothetical protein [Paraburkholderia gardini]
MQIHVGERVVLLQAGIRDGDVDRFEMGEKYIEECIGTVQRRTSA